MLFFTRAAVACLALEVFRSLLDRRGGYSSRAGIRAPMPSPTSGRAGPPGGMANSRRPLGGTRPTRRSDGASRLTTGGGVPVWLRAGRASSLLAEPLAPPAWHSEASDRPGGFGRDLDSSANRL